MKGLLKVMYKKCIEQFVVVCVVVSFFTIIWFAFVHPECGDGRMGIVLLNLSYSLLAGVFVYAFTVLFPQQNSKKALWGVVKDSVEGFGNQILNMTFEFRTGGEVFDTTQVDELIACLRKIQDWNRQSKTNVFGDVTLGEAFIKAYMELRDDIGDLITTYHELLDSEQLLLLEKLRNSEISNYVWLLNIKEKDPELCKNIFVPAYRLLLEDYNKLREKIISE